MVKIALRLKATLENIEELKPNGREFCWWLKFVCSNCGEKSDKLNDLSLAIEFSAQHARDIHHFSSKCKLCSRVNTIRIVEDSINSYTASDEGAFKTMVVFDCRGIEPIEFDPGTNWIAKATDNGTEFQNVTLSTKDDWVEYCTKINECVRVCDIEYTFDRIK